MTPKQINKIINEKVRGVWVAAHDERGHHYRFRDSDIVVDSVTTKIVIEKPHLVPWAAEIAVRYFIANLNMYDPKDETTTESIIKAAKYAWRGNRDDAGNVGTMAHQVVENYVNRWIKSGDRRPDITQFILDEVKNEPRVYAAARSMERFFVENKGIVPVASELLVGSVKERIAGTLDLLALWGKELWLLDLKTSNSALHDDYALQVAKYKRLFEEMTGLKISGAAIIGVSKDYDNYKIYDVLAPAGANRAMTHLSKYYDWERNGKPKLLERKNRIKL